MRTNPKRISKADLLTLFDTGLHHALEEALAHPDVTGIAVFENLEIRVETAELPFPPRVALNYGPGCTYKCLSELTTGHMGSVPSEFTYVRYYYRKGMRDPVKHVYVNEYTITFVHSTIQDRNTKSYTRHFYTDGIPFKWETAPLRFGRSVATRNHVAYDLEVQP